jgi:cobalamin biosynthesis Mg chelatase CobN
MLTRRKPLYMCSIIWRFERPGLLSRVRTGRRGAARVPHARGVVNPKWVQSMPRHDYKGTFEMTATVDYL